jgi:hypothetical protein
MTDFGGVSVKEMSQSVKDALLDPTVLRVLPATAANPLATLQDVVLSGGGGGGGASALVKVEAVQPVPFNTASAAFVVVPGSTINFSLIEQKVVHFIVQFPCNSFFGLNNFFDFGMKIDGADYPVERWRRGGADNTEVPVDFSYVVTLPAGAHTAEIVVRTAGGTANVDLPATLAAPIVLTAVYTEPVFGVASLASQQGENATGTPTANPTAVYTPIPGTSVAFVLQTSQVVLFEAFATALAHFTGTFGFNAQLGLRVDGLDYDGSAVHHDDFTSMVSDTVVVSKALTLAPGPHVAELVVRKESSLSTFNAIIGNNIAHPSRLTAIYTNPQQISSPFSQVTSLDKTDGSFTSGSTGGAYVDFPGLNSVVFTPGSGGEALVFISGSGATPVSNPGSQAVNIAVDGVDHVTGSEGDGIAAFTSVQGLAMNLHQGCGINGGGGGMAAIVRLTGLSAGPHTLKLRYAVAGPFGGRYYCSPSSPFRLMVMH